MHLLLSLSLFDWSYVVIYIFNIAHSITNMDTQKRKTELQFSYHAILILRVYLLNVFLLDSPERRFLIIITVHNDDRTSTFGTDKHTNPIEPFYVSAISPGGVIKSKLSWSPRTNIDIDPFWGFFQEIGDRVGYMEWMVWQRRRNLYRQ